MKCKLCKCLSESDMIEINMHWQSILFEEEEYHELSFILISKMCVFGKYQTFRVVSEIFESNILTKVQYLNITFLLNSIKADEGSEDRYWNPVKRLFCEEEIFTFLGQLYG